MTLEAVYYRAKHDRWPKRAKVRPTKAKTANPEPAAPSINSPAETTPPAAIETPGRTEDVELDAEVEALVQAAIPAPVRRPEPGAVQDPPTDWALGRALWEQGKDMLAIATALRVTIPRVQLQARKDRWPQHTIGAIVANRVCDACKLLTNRDPCQHCWHPRVKRWKDD